MTSPTASLDALLADPAAVRGLSSEQATALLSRLSSLQALLERARTSRAAAEEEQPSWRAASPVTPSPAWSEADLLTVVEAAALLRLSPRWLYRHAKDLPFTRKLSRKVLRISRSGLTRWLASKRL